MSYSIARGAIIGGAIGGFIGMVDPDKRVAPCIVDGAILGIILSAGANLLEETSGESLSGLVSGNTIDGNIVIDEKDEAKCNGLSII